MAEGGSYSISVRGSDAEFGYTCTRCAEDGINTEALKYCPECKEYLCVKCTKYHQKVSATKRHKLVERECQQDDHSFDTISAVMKKRDKCGAHAERDIEMYCRSHDMVYCTMCIAKNHRSCPEVFELEEAVNLFSTQSDDITNSKVESVVKKLTKFKQKKADNIRTLEKQTNEILMKVQGTKDKLVKHLEKLAKDTSSKVNTAHKNLKKVLENERDSLAGCITSVENSRRQLNDVATLDKTERFVKEKLQKSVLSASENLLDDASLYESQKITFKKNDELIYQIMTATSLMQIEENRCKKTRKQKLPPSIKSKRKVNVTESDDNDNCSITEYPCYLTDICQLPDGTTVLTDGNNCKVKRLDDQYKVRDNCKLDSFPAGICCTGTNEVAIKLLNEVQFVSVGTVMSKTRTFDIEVDEGFGFVSFADKLWCDTGQGINIYSMSGIILKTLKPDSFGKHLLGSSETHLIFTVGSDKSSIYVSDLDNNVVCLDHSENVKMKLTNTKLKNVVAVCTSSDGTVFVAGYESHNIMMFGSDGKCLGELVAPDQGIKCPRSLCYDSKKHQLIFGCESNDIIVVLDLDV